MMLNEIQVIFCNNIILPLVIACQRFMFSRFNYDFIFLFPVAAEAIKVNASLNNVTLDINTQNLIGQSSDQWDVIFLGDMFYDQDFTNMVTDWLEDLHTHGKTILIGDPGRVYFEKHPLRQRLKMLFTTDLFQHTREENNGITQGYVWAFT